MADEVTVEDLVEHMCDFAAIEGHAPQRMMVGKGFWKAAFGEEPLINTVQETNTRGTGWKYSNKIEAYLCLDVRGPDDAIAFIE